ncbi:GNAT family N-acetyltransferase [Bacillus manliponensis]|uniref:GNAT family N-acetyltransferase n=1 Tax=Bacillus manliponensis TaxID=574376 RepID=UPI00351538FE
MDIIIKKIELEDLGNLTEIDDSFHIDSKLVLSMVDNTIAYTVKDIPSYKKSYLEDSYIENQEDVQDYREYIDNPNKVMFLAFMNQHLIGQVIVKRHWNGFAYVEDIKVDKQFRKLGVGKRLLEKVKFWTQANEMPGIMLETQTNNVGACKFYEKSGFVIGGFDFLIYKGIHAESDEAAIYWYLRF